MDNQIYAFSGLFPSVPSSKALMLLILVSRLSGFFLVVMLIKDALYLVLLTHNGVLLERKITTNPNLFPFDQGIGVLISVPLLRRNNRLYSGTNLARGNCDSQNQKTVFDETHCTLP